jgi:hypothetical protein
MISNAIVVPSVTTTRLVASSAGAALCSTRKAVFRRPLIQVAIGVAVGGLLIALAAEGFADSETSNAGSGMSFRLLAQLVANGTPMFAVCLVACVVPTRRAVSVESTESTQWNATWCRAWQPFTSRAIPGTTATWCGATQHREPACQAVALAAFGGGSRSNPAGIFFR